MPQCAVLEEADDADGFGSNYESALNYKTKYVSLTYEIQHATFVWTRHIFFRLVYVDFKENYILKFDETIYKKKKNETVSQTVSQKNDNHDKTVFLSGYLSILLIFIFKSNCF